jgi:hypothetical protein
MLDKYPGNWSVYKPTANIYICFEIFMLYCKTSSCLHAAGYLFSFVFRVRLLDILTEVLHCLHERF